MYKKNSYFRKAVKAITKKISTLAIEYAESKKAKERLTTLKTQETTILHLLISDKTPIETIDLLEVVVDRVRDKLIETKEEYLKQLRAINEFI